MLALSFAPRRNRIRTKTDRGREKNKKIAGGLSAISGQIQAPRQRSLPTRTFPDISGHWSYTSYRAKSPPTRTFPDISGQAK